MNSDSPPAHRHTDEAEHHLVEEVRIKNSLMAEASRSQGTDGWTHHHVLALLLEHGRLFTWSPVSFPRWFGPQGECYRNASLYAEDQPGLVYVEGLAVTAAHAAFGMDTPHAWCADQSTVIDPSPGWHEKPVVYLGVPFTHEYRRRVQRREGVFGLLWSVAGVDVVRHGLPDDAVVPDVGRPLPVDVEP